LDGCQATRLGILPFFNPYQSGPVHKGGGDKWHSFELHRKGYVWLKSFINMLDGKKLTNKSTHAAKTSIQVSKLAGRKDDKEKLSRDDLHSEERLGIAIGLLRRRKKITYEILALEKGFRVELLMALESGTLDRTTIIRS